jgi:ribosomal protein L9
MVDFPIDKRKVELDKTLRQAGNYEVSIKLAQQLEPVIRVIIEPAEE